jgi:hypothetical protein
MVQRFVMPAERKLSEEELVRLRRLSADGWTPADLAEAFGVTPQHVGRLLRGERRPALADADPDPGLGDVSAACAAFLEAAELDSVGEVLAATARALVAKLDACGASDAATAAQAAPRIAAQVVDVPGELRSRAPREPDEIDRIKARREARLAALAVRVNGRGRDRRMTARKTSARADDWQGCPRVVRGNKLEPPPWWTTGEGGAGRARGSDSWEQRRRPARNERPMPGYQRALRLRFPGGFAVQARGPLRRSISQHVGGP